MQLISIDKRAVWCGTKHGILEHENLRKNLIIQDLTFCHPPKKAKLDEEKFHCCFEVFLQKSKISRPSGGTTINGGKNKICQGDVII